MDLGLEAGMMVSGAAFDLARLMETTFVTLDVNSFNDIVYLMAQHNCTLGATSFPHNLLLT